MLVGDFYGSVEIGAKITIPDGLILRILEGSA
jgi:hypothetical protein